MGKWSDFGASILPISQKKCVKFAAGVHTNEQFIDILMFNAIIVNEYLEFGIVVSCVQIICRLHIDC